MYIIPDLICSTEVETVNSKGPVHRGVSLVGWDQNVTLWAENQALYDLANTIVKHGGGRIVLQSSSPFNL